MKPHSRVTSPPQLVQTRSSLPYLLRFAFYVIPPFKLVVLIITVILSKAWTWGFWLIFLWWESSLIATRDSGTHSWSQPHVIVMRKELSLFSFRQPWSKRKGQKFSFLHAHFIKNRAAISGTVHILVDLSTLISAMKPTSQLRPPPCSANSTFWHADI